MRDRLGLNWSKYYDLEKTFKHKNSRISNYLFPVFFSKGKSDSEPHLPELFLSII